jgi:hypothetical protein
LNRGKRKRRGSRLRRNRGGLAEALAMETWNPAPDFISQRYTEKRGEILVLVLSLEETVRCSGIRYQVPGARKCKRIRCLIVVVSGAKRNGFRCRNRNRIFRYQVPGIRCQAPGTGLFEYDKAQRCAEYRCRDQDRVFRFPIPGNGGGRLP